MATSIRPSPPISGRVSGSPGRRDSVSGKTVLRSGFGIFYGPGQIEDQIQPIESDRIQLTQSGGLYPVDITALRNNFLNNPNNRQYQPRAYSPDYRIPERIYQYSFSIQQELPGKMTLTAAYVGSQGRNLFLRNWSNKIVQVLTNPDPTKSAIVIRQFDIVQPDGTVLKPYAEIDYKTSGGWDSYNALQVGLGRRFNSGVTLNSQYTFGKSFGNTSGSNDALTSGNGNGNDYSYDVGYNNFDVRHSFNLSAVYALPFGARLGRISGSPAPGLGNRHHHQCPQRHSHGYPRAAQRRRLRRRRRALLQQPCRGPHGHHQHHRRRRFAQCPPAGPDPRRESVPAMRTAPC